MKLGNWSQAVRAMKGVMIVLTALLPVAAHALSCHAVDGDTIRCGPELIRLLGIDAPEKPGNCRTGRQCAPGDHLASTASLAGMMENDPIRIERDGQDIYRRTLANVSAGETDLSCGQLRRGQAIYVARWDNGGRVARLCPDVAVPAAGRRATDQR